MDSRTKGTVLTIVGIASVAALGAAIGAASYRGHPPRQLLRRGKRRVERMADWDSLARLVERVADALPKRESDRLLERVKSRVRDR